MRFENKKNKKGFTLVEMLVSLSIIGILLTVVLWNQSKFNNDIDVANLAYRVALAVREAQVYGVSVRAFDGEFEHKAYGVHFYFDQNDDDDPNRKNLLVYADLDNDFVYDGDHDQGIGNNDYGTTECPQNTECVERLGMNRGNKIVDICLEESAGGVIECLDEVGGGSYADIRSVDILFKRPNPDAIFSTYNANGQNVESQLLNAIYICLESPQQTAKQVIVYATGQISITGGCTTSSLTADGEQGSGDNQIGDEIGGDEELNPGNGNGPKGGNGSFPVGF